ncbi:MAG: PaaI family thioesterase [Burkholderiaceae bacterium]|nr:PaaI family thioesterase [Burkholderiaceae bacterium]
MHIDLDTLRAFFHRAPFMVDLGVEPIAVQAGKVTTELILQARHLQHTGVVHAGVVASLADHTMGAAAQTCAAEGFWVLTAELKTSLLRGAQGERLVCEAVVLKAGRQVSFTEAEVYAISGDTRTMVAKASATMALAAANKTNKT